MSILSFAKKKKKEKKPAVDAPKKQTAEQVAVPAAVGVIDLVPVLTEKSVRLQEQNVVTFRVPHAATKEDITRAVAARFGVQPKEIRVIRGRGKHRRRGATFGQTAQWKKAYVKVDDVAALTSTP
jgi:large subunit ribosomal protein L23